MSGITGIVNLNQNVASQLEEVQHMTEAIRRRGKKKIKLLNYTCAAFGCANFYEYGEDDAFMPLTVHAEGKEYSIVLDGSIYNLEEIRSDLAQKGIVCKTKSPAEVILQAYIKWGIGCLQRMNGIFAFAVWNECDSELFLARDRFGIKPLYYTTKCGNFLFASEIKGVLAHKDIDAVLTKEGLSEVLGLGPAHTQGSGIFQGILELKPAHCALFNRSGLSVSRYWALQSSKHPDDFETTVSKVHSLVTDAFDKQISVQDDLCCFLSGGVDSSSIVAYAAKKLERPLHTFSLEYVGNNEYFKPTEYQPESDNFYIDKMSETFGTDHEIITVTNQDLLDNLENAVIARDAPGMGDVDSSLFCFCNSVGQNYSIAMSGECGDEVFGGYPWFHRKEDFEADIFPWAKNLNLRENLIHPDISGEINVTQYIRERYEQSVAQTPRLSSDTADEKRRREISHLNLNWFMYTLGERSERIGMYNGLEIRMPFCDHKVVEYLWNVPWEFKSHNEREKGLLREALHGMLPEDVLWRKKSPFPKTHNPAYEELVKARMIEILNDSSSPVLDIINKEYLMSLTQMPSDYGKPWFGQLMATPQLYAYVVQLDFWLRHYHVNIL